jgi:hypothetical protein
VRYVRLDLINAVAPLAERSTHAGARPDVDIHLGDVFEQRDGPAALVPQATELLALLYLVIASGLVDYFDTIK